MAADGSESEANYYSDEAFSVHSSTMNLQEADGVDDRSSPTRLPLRRRPSHTFLQGRSARPSTALGRAPRGLFADVGLPMAERSQSLRKRRRGGYVSSPWTAAVPPGLFDNVVSEQDTLLEKTEVDLGDEDILEDTASTVQTGFNVLNMFVGLGLMSKPYALAQAGWVSLPMLGVLCVAACYAGKIIVRTTEQAVKGGRPSFTALARLALGPTGEWMVVMLVFMEFFGGVCLNLLSIWKNVLNLRSDWSPIWVALVSTLVLIPSVLIRR